MRLARKLELERLQWLSTDELQSRQFIKFKNIVAYAYQNVPFYQQQFKSIGFEPEGLESLDDIKKLPTLTKKDIQLYLAELCSKKFTEDELNKDSSGGSTGTPTVFYTEKNTRYLRRGAVLMSDSWTGWKVGEMSSYLWGADRDTSVIQSIKDNLVHKYIHRTSLLNAFELDDRTMRGHIESLNQERPTLIIAYTNVAFFFAKFLQETGLTIPSPKGVVCSAETLTEEKRRVIETAFGCKVLNRYASREIGLIAAECPHQKGLHINTEDVYVEIDNDGINEYGEIVVTDFNNHAMPLIRYQTGDVGSISKKSCDCDRGLPIMDEVKGRTSDFILHPGGHLIHGESFSHAFYGIREIARFQVHKKTIQSLEINLVEGKGFSNIHKKMVSQKVKEIIGEEVSIKINVVSDIPLPVSGKFKFAISDIAN